MEITGLDARSIKAAPVVPQSVTVTIPMPPIITDIPLANAVTTIAPRRSIAHPDIVTVALPVYYT